LLVGHAPGEVSLEGGAAHLFGALSEDLLAIELRHGHDPPPVCLVDVFALEGVGDVCCALWNVILAV
jgi:hypothetical protein